MGGLTSASIKKKKKKNTHSEHFFMTCFLFFVGGCGGINCLAKCTLNRSSEENKQNISDKTKSHSCFFSVFFMRRYVSDLWVPSPVVFFCL